MAKLKNSIHDYSEQENKRRDVELLVTERAIEEARTSKMSKLKVFAKEMEQKHMLQAKVTIIINLN
jgi:hypothetical protein